MADSGTDFSPEVHFAQRLAANEKKIRDRAIRKLRRWLGAKSSATKGGFTETDFLKIWKGLHYCLWMQDKPIIQEELSKNITSLTHVFGNVDIAFLFVQVFFQTEAREWNGIDRWRLDKFMMLVRQMLHQVFVLVCQHGWKDQHIDRWNGIMTRCVMTTKGDLVPDGLKIHIADIFLDELEKTGAKELTPEKVIKFLEPFMTFLPLAKNAVIIKRVISRIFEAIIDQTAQNALSQAEQELEEEEESEGKLAQRDITAGAEDADESGSDSGEDDAVHKMIEPDESTHLQFDIDVLANKLFELGSKKDCSGKNRTLIYGLVKKFRNLQEGVLPEDAAIDVNDISKQEVEAAVHRLEKMETPTSARKKKKKKRKENDELMESASSQTAESACSQAANEEMYSSKSKKAKKTKKHVPLSEDSEEAMAQTEQSERPRKKVKKRKQTDVSTSSELESRPEKRKKKANKDKSAESLIPTDSEISRLSSNSFDRGNENVNSDDIHCIKVGKKRKKKEKDGESNVEIVHMSPRNRKVNCSDLQSDEGDDGEQNSLKISKKWNKVTVQGKNRTNQISSNKKKTPKQKKPSLTDLKNRTGQGEVTPVQKLSHSQFESSDKESDEVEIWVPNKKYKGKLKGLFNKQAQSQEADTEEGKQSTSFASFEPLSQTPPAFVRKAVLKSRTPKTEPRKRITKQEDLSTPLSEKRVSFNMRKNTSLKFIKDSFPFSPHLPPTNQRPTQGILKSPASASPASIRKSHHSKGKSPKTRPRAADFF